MGNAMLRVGSYQRLVQQLPFLMGHIRDEQAEKDVQPLDLCRQH